MGSTAFAGGDAADNVGPVANSVSSIGSGLSSQLYISSKQGLAIGDVSTGCLTAFPVKPANDDQRQNSYKERTK